MMYDMPPRRHSASPYVTGTSPDSAIRPASRTAGALAAPAPPGLTSACGGIAYGPIPFLAIARRTTASRSTIEFLTAATAAGSCLAGLVCMSCRTDQ